MDDERNPRAVREWFKLDNAAKIFPGQITEKWSNIIRISVNLTEPVDPELLKRALAAVLPRFPSLAVRIRRGIFWYYFERNTKEPLVLPDINNPCIRIRFSENNGFLFRVFYYRNRISLEIFHALTDGYGSAVFLSTLTAEYLRLKGHEIPCGGMVFDIAESSKLAELEDSFLRFANTRARLPRAAGGVYHYRADKLPKYHCHIISGTMPLDKLKSVAAGYGATITEFMAAVLMEEYLTLQSKNARRQKTVSIQIPVNARNRFPSETLRNFSVCYEMRLDPNLGKYDFAEIVRQTSLYLRYINNSKTLGAIFGRNVRLELSPLMRPIPLFIKDIGVGISFFVSAEKSTTGIFTNLGKIDIPDEMAKFVESCILMPSPGLLNGGRAGAVSVGNKLTVTFADSFADTTVERMFFTRLVGLGIPVKIESNLNDPND